jgi:hypothetical protein
VRPLLKLYGQQGTYTTNIDGHQIKDSQKNNDKGALLSIPINQCLTPVILSCDFTLQQEQFSDADALNTLAVEAAYRVVAAEDAIGRNFSSDCFFLHVFAAARDGGFLRGSSAVGDRVSRVVVGLSYHLHSSVNAYG